MNKRIYKGLLITLITCLIPEVHGQFIGTFYLNSDYEITAKDSFAILYEVQQFGNDIKVLEYYPNKIRKSDYYYLLTDNEKITNENYFDLIKSRKLLLDREYYSFDYDGQLFELSIYEKGKLVHEPIGYPIQVDGPPYFVVLDPVKFLHQDYKGFIAYLNNNLKYPKKAKEDKIQGVVRVQFTISKEGAIFNVGVIRSVNKQLDKEAVRLIKNSPKWIPNPVSGERDYITTWIDVEFGIFE